MKDKNLESKKCSNTTCGCTSVEVEENQETSQQATKEKPAETLDPTHFGDWQVNCRAIDF